MAYKFAEARFPARGASALAFPLAALMLVAEVLMIVSDQANVERRFLLAGLCPMFGMLLSACTVGKLGAPTTMITGHLTTLGMGVVKACMEGGLSGSERCKMIL